MPVYILGINAYHPDSSACIIRDGRLIAAVEEERFRRIKHWAGFPTHAISYCLEEAGIKVDDVTHVAINRNPRANALKKAIFVFRRRPSTSLMRARFLNIMKISDVKRLIREHSSENVRLHDMRVWKIEHHRAHLASAFFVSPFESAAVVSIDGFGDFTSCMVAIGEGNKLRPLYEVNFPHSLGMFYMALTQYLGFKRFGDEYKVMGLSAYGKPRFAEEMGKILRLKPEGRFELDLNYFSFHRDGGDMTWEDCEPRVSDTYSRKLEELLGPSRRPEDPIDERHCDIAASLQHAYEHAFFHVLNYAHRLVRSTRLCLAGGCALNSLANGKIYDVTPFREVYIQPAASDAGGSLGAGFYVWHHILNNEREFIMEHAYWGPDFDEGSIESAIYDRSSLLRSYSVERLGHAELCKKVARFIADGKIVGWFQGRTEWGPRALGNRSLLVDPRRAEMKDILNERIKRREWFRPFAPTVLEEKVGEYFEKTCPDPFMIKVYPVREEKRNLIPAVTHVDGTGRLQTVNKEQNPLYWKLIREFEAITGIPVLLNTSFNENEPIVNTPEEAIDCFLRTKMDVLAIGPFLISKA